ncbi:uncharacterized protein LOC116846720 [Odontomachus brunneus]|uniref:uncharacterized protein LOC116846720 n=1 Tax=Odontomachus brunneus TaxID=486640 RepID=UPI0013F29D96|nr:uncharacterized protein LOC116846720 [Odontomachus brunneus]
MARLVWHLSRKGPDINDAQHGFSVGRSTVDAILRLGAFAEAEMEEERVVVATSLDITNAFNSLPWDRVEKAMRTALPPGSTVVCYADDTLVLSGGTDWGEATALANVAVECVVRSIRALGLRVAPNKTEALFLHGRFEGPPPQAHIMVADTRMKVGSMLKSPSLTLDGTSGFVEHFKRLSFKLGRIAGALAYLLPNFGGPRTLVRRLYAITVHSMALYGAPVWAGEMGANRRIKTLVNSAQRVMANRLTRAYRIVSHAAVTVLAGMIPADLLARVYADTYTRLRRLRQKGEDMSAGTIGRIRALARRRAFRYWKRQLGGAQRAGQADHRGHPPLSPRMGGQGPRRVKLPPDRCSPGTAASAWAAERDVLIAVAGRDLSLLAVVPAMVESKEA